MYIISKVDFDSSENEINSARNTEIIGVIEGGESDVRQWIDKNPIKKWELHKGWDGKTYPYYTYESTRKLE